MANTLSVTHKQLHLGMQTLPGNYSLLMMAKRSRLRVNGGRVWPLARRHEAEMDACL